MQKTLEIELQELRERIVQNIMTQIKEEDISSDWYAATKAVKNLASIVVMQTK